MFNPASRVGLFVAVALLTTLRLPDAWRHGRFLDEEATVFLAYAWHRPWLEALLRPFGGYLNLAATATTTLLARLLQSGTIDMVQAPRVTMTIALLAQLIPAALLLTGRAPWLHSRLGVVASLLFVAVVPGTEEVFFNAMHIQFHLALGTALVLALDPPAGRVGTIAYAALLLVAPLCGPGAIVLVPLFVGRAVVDRDPRRLVQAVALGIGTALQLLFFYGANPMRGHLADPPAIAAAMFVRLIVLPLWGFPQAFHTGHAVFASYAAGESGWWWAAGGAVLILGTLVLVAARHRDAALWMVVSALALAVSSFGYGMVIIDPFDRFSPGAGERYNFVPLVLLALSLIALAGRYGPRRGFPAMFLCVFALIVASRDYLRPLPIYADGPDWPSEVATWQRDHDHALAVWPRPWRADLSDRNTRCPSSADQPTALIAPRYCESGWVASFRRPSPAKR